MKKFLCVLLTVTLFFGILSLSTSAIDLSWDVSSFLTLTEGDQTYSISARDLNATTREITLAPKTSLLSSLFKKNIVGSFSAQTISSSQVPAGISPAVCKTQEEADMYLTKVVYSLETQAQTASTVTVPKNATLRNAVLDTKTLGLIANVRLQLTYSTSNTQFTYAKPYTTHTGLTFDTEWKQSSCGYTMNTAKTQVTAYAEGTATFYLIVKGLYKLYSRQISLRGVAKI